MILIYLFFLTCFLFNDKNVLTTKFENTLQTSVIAQNHGYLIGYFTFTGKGVAGLKYSITPLLNHTHFKLSVFPMAYDSYANLKRISMYYSQASCNDFYHKTIYNVNINKQSDSIPLGRFSGGFAVAVVLSDKYVCPPNLRHLDSYEEIESVLIETTVEMLNPNDDGEFSDQLSATDRGVSQTIQVLLVLYIAMGLWAAYSVLCNASVEIPLMLVIQKMACLIISIHILIYILLLVVYHRLSQSGTAFNEIELLAELLAVICRYMELYIVISWTLSSQRDSGRTGDIVARIIGGCAVLHTVLAAGHFGLLDKMKWAYSCSTVWDCESHLFSMGFGNPIRYDSTSFGIVLLILNFITSLGASMFVLHLLKMGLGITEFSVRRAYMSVFCSASLLWFWSYPTIWMVSGLITDYYQYKFVVFMVSVSHLCAVPAILRVTMLSSIKIESNSPASIAIYD